MGRFGIPTRYRGVQYRSRLEAKWAAFFDLLEWSHQYEPFDLDGWIPDFILPGLHPAPTLVEIKPVTEIPNDVASRIGRFSAQFSLLILGCTITTKPTEMLTQIGWIKDADLGHWARASLHHGGFRNIKVVVPELTSIPPGWSRLEWLGHLHKTNLGFLDLWNRAGNAVQWRGTRSEV